MSTFLPTPTAHLTRRTSRHHRPLNALLLQDRDLPLGHEAVRLAWSGRHGPELPVRHSPTSIELMLQTLTPTRTSTTIEFTLIPVGALDGEGVEEGGEVGVAGLGRHWGAHGRDDGNANGRCRLSGCLALALYQRGWDRSVVWV